MDCSYFRTLGSAIVDNEATDTEIKEFNDHITTCPDCAKWFETLKVLKTADLTCDAPDALKTRVMASVENADKKPSFFKRFRFTAVAAAVAVIVIAVNSFIGTPPEENSSQPIEETSVMSGRMAPQPDKITTGVYGDTPENIYDRAFSFVIYVKDNGVESLLDGTKFEEKDGYKYYITDSEFDDFSHFSQEIIALNLSLDTQGLVIVKAVE